MVAVMHAAPQAAAPQAVAAWLETRAVDYSADERASFAAAFAYARARTGDAAIAHYDHLLRSSRFASTHRPEMVIRIGDLPTSKPLRTWLAERNRGRACGW
jgi:2-succinyl-5-enolpyruvyl-6-hydroxy-3-cyclohexene-1-carboxylate synthase